MIGLPGTAGGLALMGLFCLAGLIVGCSPTPLPEPLALESPASGAAMAPALAQTSRGLALTWLEPRDGGEGAAHYAFQASWLEGDRWSPAMTVTGGGDFFANWADVPGLGAGPERLYAHRLKRMAAGTYDYGIELLALTENGEGQESWQSLGWLHDDTTPSEHGFVSYAQNGDALQAFWLDGRAMPGGGAMMLRTTDVLAPERESVLLDERVCECCPTDAAVTSTGPVVVYRNRSENEIRDIAIVRSTSSGWSEPQLVHDDGWQIEGCPVNGPTVAAEGDRVVVAWFTAPQGWPAVRVAWSDDGGKSFAAPLDLDDDRPVGRTDVAIEPSGRAWVAWLGRTQADASQAVLRLARIDGPGAAPVVQDVATTQASRDAGFPKLALDGDRLVIAWIETGATQALRTALLPLSS